MRIDITRVNVLAVGITPMAQTKIWARPVIWVPLTVAGTPPILRMLRAIPLTRAIVVPTAVARTTGAVVVKCAATKRLERRFRHHDPEQLSAVLRYTAELRTRLVGRIE